MEILTFPLAGEHFGIVAQTVEEIRAWEGATRIPTLPDYVKGVVNLRGSIVPIVDLRNRFGMETLIPVATSVVVYLCAGSKSRRVGLLIDDVPTIVNVENAELLTPANLGSHIDLSFLRALIDLDGALTMLLNEEALVDEDAMYQPLAQVRIATANESAKAG